MSTPWGDIGGFVVGGVPGMLAGDALAGGPIFGGGDSGPGFTFNNPGQIDLAKENPGLNNEIMKLQGYRSQFDATAQQNLNRGQYDARTADMQQRAQTASMNRYGMLGLGGSSAAVGAADENARQIDFSRDDQFLGRQLKTLQMQQALSGSITKDMLAGQNQYAQYQQSMANFQLGKDTIDSNNQNAMIGAIGTVGGMAAGAMIGGPAGAGIGGSIGGSLANGMTGGQQPMPGDGMMGAQNSYSDPYGLGYSGGYGDMGPAMGTGAGMYDTSGYGLGYQGDYGMGGMNTYAPGYY